MGEGRHLKWIVKDVEQFEQAREYVDTGVIPLFINFNSERNENGSRTRGIYRIVEYGARKRI